MLFSQRKPFRKESQWHSQEGTLCAQLGLPHYACCCSTKVIFFFLFKCHVSRLHHA